MNRRESQDALLGLMQISLAVIVMFSQFCLFEWISVKHREYLENFHDRSWEWLLCFIPVPAFFACYLLGKKFTTHPFWQALVTTLIGIICTVPCILMFGVMFYFWIGGRP